MSRRQIPFLALLFCLLAVYQPRVSGQPAERLAQQGFLDLTGWDLNSLTNLKGEWEFHWNQLLSPDDFREHPPLPSGYIQVPSDWRGFSHTQPLPVNGFATYRLKVKCPQSDEPLGLIVPHILTAYTLWIDEQLVMGNGKPAKTKAATLPADYPKAGFFTSQGDFFWITIQVANFHDISAGIYMAPQLGRASNILQIMQIHRLNETLVAGILFVFAIYHIGLFLLRRKDASMLFFGLFCILIMLRSIFYGEALFSLFFPALPYEIYKRFESLPIFMGSAIYAFFFYTQFKEWTHKWLAYGLLVIGAIFTLICLITPLTFYAQFYDQFLTIMIICSLYFLVKAIALAGRKKEGAVIFLIGHLVFIFSVILEITSFNKYFFGGFFTPRGMAIFIFIQAFLLAKKSTSAFQKVETLTNELQLYSKSLEEKVNLRTQELENTIKQKTQFFINLSHEIKTPLTLITNYFDKYISVRQTTELEVIKRNLDKLKYDIMNYLDWEKIQFGKVFYDHNQFVNLTNLIKEKFILFKELASNKQIELQATVNEDLYIQADPFAIDRVLNNLLDNAIKYNRKQGEVLITLQKKAELMELSVQDTGIGVSPEKLKTLFLPFQQLNHPKKNTEGMGVGLSIVKGILDAIQATITIESTPDAGTKIFIHFKQTKELPHDVVQPPVSLPNDFSFSKKAPACTPYDPDRYTLLLTEDNEDMLAFLFDELSQDYNLMTAHNGLEALAALRTVPRMDLIISDVMMDQMNGYDFFKHLKEQTEYQHIPFIFLTVRNILDEKIAQLSAGAVDYIIKPFNMKEVRAKIMALLLFKERQKDHILQEASFVLENKKLPELSLSTQENLILEQLNINCHKFDITKREQEIISYLLKGLEYKEIARELDLAVKTVDNHLQRLYTKMQVHNKIDLLNKLILKN